MVNVVCGCGVFVYVCAVCVLTYLLSTTANKAVLKESGGPVKISWEKMSKSKFNGVDPAVRHTGVCVVCLRMCVYVCVASHA